MEKREQIYEGKAKKVYATDDEGYVINNRPQFRGKIYKISAAHSRGLLG